MSTWFWIFMGIAFGLPVVINVLLRWVVAPCMIRRRQYMAMRPVLEVGDTQRLTPELRQAVETAVAQFEAQGFERAACLYSTGGVPGVTGTQAMLVNRATRDIALVIATWSGLTRSAATVVRSEFADGTRVMTGVNRGIGVFPRDPLVDGLIFAWVRDPATLCEAHQRRLARLGKGGVPRVAPAAGEEIRYSIAEWDRELLRYERVGYMWRDDAARRYRYTWKGAFLSAWKLSQPVKGWRIKWRDRRARREWVELGMESWRADARPAAMEVNVALPPAPPPPLPPTAFSPPHASSDLRYEAVLTEGVIHQESAGGVLTVRMGRETHGQFLARHWGTMVMIAFWLAMIGVWLLVTWHQHVRRAFVPGMPARESKVATPLFVGLFFLAMDVYRLVRGLWTLRGPTVLTASAAGLTFEGAPAWRGSGRIAREEVDGLRVVLHRAGFRKRTYRMEVFQHAGRTQRLLVGADKEAMERVRQNIAVAMGIEAAPMPADGSVAAEVLEP